MEKKEKRKKKWVGGGAVPRHQHEDTFWKDNKAYVLQTYYILNNILYLSVQLY